MKVYTDGKSDWRKINGNAFDLLKADGVTAFMDNYNKKDVRFICGHNRFGTTGARDNDSTHPFDIGRITLMHNGTLDKWCPLLDFDKFKVDSEAICNSIDKKGIEETLKNIRGAFALVYYDNVAKTLNLIRNKERPLFLGVHPEVGRIYFASEFGMLKWILNRNNILSAKIELIPEYQLVSFGINNFIPEVKDMEKHKFSYQTSYMGHHSRYADQVWDVDTQSWKDKPDPLGLLPALFKKQSKKERKNLSLVENSFVRPIGLLTRIENLYGYKVGDSIVFKLIDYKETNKEQENYIIEGWSDCYPDVTFWMYLKGVKLLDELLEAKFIRAIIRSMQFNRDSKINDKATHRMWVADPVPSQVEGLEEKKPVVCPLCHRIDGTHTAFCNKNWDKDDITAVEEAEIVTELERSQMLSAFDLEHGSIN